MVAQKADAGLKQTTSPSGVGQCIRHDFRCGRDGDGQLVGQTQPDQTKPVNGITCCPDLFRILIRDCHAEICDVLGGLAQRRAVDAAEGEGSLITQQGRRDRRLLGRWHELGKRGHQPDCSDATIQTCLTMKVLFGMALRQIEPWKRHWSE